MMAERTDDRVLDVPMQPVQCLRCDAQVEVRKSSWQQTSIQWHQEAMAACQERAANSSAPAGCQVDACTALRDSIARAAQQGNIHVPDDGY